MLEINTQTVTEADETIGLTKVIWMKSWINDDINKFIDQRKKCGRYWRIIFLISDVRKGVRKGC